jgi:hypothetical protein
VAQLIPAVMCHQALSLSHRVWTLTPDLGKVSGTVLKPQTDLCTINQQKRITMTFGVVAAATLAAAPEDDTFLPGFADEGNR